MGISMPTGPYAQQMISPGGWIGFNEDILWNRAGNYTEVLNKVSDVLGTAKHQQSEIFSGGVWSGGAADAANNKLGSNIEDLTTLQNDTASVINWHKQTAGLIEQTKSIIYDNVHLSQVQIATWEADPTLDPEARDAAIVQLVSNTHSSNVEMVGTTADQIQASKSMKASPNLVQNLLGQQGAPDLGGGVSGLLGGVKGTVGQVGQTVQTTVGQVGQTVQTTASNVVENAPSTGQLAATAQQGVQVAQSPVVQQGFQQGQQISQQMQQMSQSAQQGGSGGGTPPPPPPSQLARDGSTEGATDEDKEKDKDKAKDKELEGAGAAAGKGSGTAPILQSGTTGTSTGGVAL